MIMMIDKHLKEILKILIYNFNFIMYIYIILYDHSFWGNCDHAKSRSEFLGWLALMGPTGSMGRERAAGGA